jgi:magnesium-transporting ATPase (P-type)
VSLAGLFIGGAGYLFFDWALGHGVGEVEARSALLLLMVLFENVHVFNSRSEVRSVFRVPIAGNPLVAASVVLALGLHVAASRAPGVGGLLHVVPMPAELWLVVVPIALGLVAAFEVYKRFRPRN